MNDTITGVNKKNEKAKEMGQKEAGKTKKKERRGNRFCIRDLYIMILGFCGENR